MNFIFHNGFYVASLLPLIIFPQVCTDALYVYAGVCVNLCMDVYVCIYAFMLKYIVCIIPTTVCRVYVYMYISVRVYINFILLSLRMQYWIRLYLGSFNCRTLVDVLSILCTPILCLYLYLILCMTHESDVTPCWSIKFSLSLYLYLKPWVTPLLMVRATLREHHLISREIFVK